MTILLLVIVYDVHDHCLRQGTSNVELNCVAKQCTCFPPFLTCSWCPPVKGWKQRALSVISRSSPLSEFTVCIVRRGFAYWGIGGRTGALTTETSTIDWHDAKIVDPVEPTCDAQ